MITDLLDGQRQVDETESCLETVEKHRHRLVTFRVYTQTTSTYRLHCTPASSPVAEGPRDAPYNLKLYVTTTVK